MSEKDVVFPANRNRTRPEPIRHPVVNLPGVGGSVSMLKPQGKKNIEQFSPFADREVGHFRHFVVAQDQMNPTGILTDHLGNVFHQQMRGAAAV